MKVMVSAMNMLIDAQHTLTVAVLGPLAPALHKLRHMHRASGQAVRMGIETSKQYLQAKLQGKDQKNGGVAPASTKERGTNVPRG